MNSMSVARYRERHSTSGAKSDAGDAHLLAEMVRLDRVHHRPVAWDSPQAYAVKLIARAHQSLIWDRSRHVLRLRAALREFFPAALEAFADLDAPDTLELLGQAPGPEAAAALSQAKIAAALRRVRRRDAAGRAVQMRAVLRAPQLRQPPPVEAAYAAVVRLEPPPAVRSLTFRNVGCLPPTACAFIDFERRLTPTRALPPRRRLASAKMRSHRPLCMGSLDGAMSQLTSTPRPR